jgi:hypothetical protein
MVDLNCLNDIITDNLAIHIDLTDLDSWDLNTGFTSISLTEWSGAVSDDLTLLDFGLTAYDNGRVNDICAPLNLTSNDTKVQLYRVGYNISTGGTFYDGFGITGVTETELILGSEFSGDTIQITGVTGTSDFVGNHFNVDGGWLQGFFKLDGYNYEVFPRRYNNGITIETIIRIDDDSFNDGIIYHMGTRAEDKYNPEFSGESRTVTTVTRTPVRTGVVGLSRIVTETTSGFTGVRTSENNVLNAYVSGQTQKDAIQIFEDKFDQTFNRLDNSKNIADNILALILRRDGRLAYRYANEDGNIVTRNSTSRITQTGWTVIAFSFKPEFVFEDEDLLECNNPRTGTLTIYVNGRSFFSIPEFKEFFFNRLNNSREKQIGVPFNISWGGGSFGLKHSYHFDFQDTILYAEQDQTYIDDNLTIGEYPLLVNPCPISGGTVTAGEDVSLSADTSTFFSEDQCDPTIQIPETVLRVEQSGATGLMSGQTFNQYFISTVLPNELKSNRDYTASVDIFDTGIFMTTFNDSRVTNTIKLVVYGTEDIEILDTVEYTTNPTLVTEQIVGPFPTSCDFEYFDSETGLLIDGETGIPSATLRANNGVPERAPAPFVTGLNQFLNISTTFRLKENTGRQQVFIGILLDSTAPLNSGFTLFIDNFKYNGADLLVQDQ